MEERREMNGQRMMTREELEMRLPALNHIAEQRDAKFRLRYAEKTLNNGIERGYTLDAGTRVSVNVYQNERWAQMPDEELFDTLNDLDGRYCVTEDQETIGERLNAFFKSGELFEKIYPVVVSENNMESFAKAGITFDRYLDMLITYRVELMQMNDGIGTLNTSTLPLTRSCSSASELFLSIQTSNGFDPTGIKRPWACISFIRSTSLRLDAW